MCRSTFVSSVAVVLTLLPATAAAQPPPSDPLSLYAVDIRGAIPFLGGSPETAASLGIAPTQLPTRGLGIAAGAHVYPLRRRSWAIGIGGEWLYSRGSIDLVPIDESLPGRTIARRFESLSGQLSLNFGHRNGWSYLSGGAGPLVFDTWEKPDSPDGARAMTLNYGGGGRWFTRPRLAFTFDLRFYATRPAEPTLVVGARGKQTVMVITVGVSVR